ncbi:MAG: cation:proton antiporter [Hyphomonadaceae bacterium]|nr:cation:proton antiporter [Hyphomonadaceae bacterium]
MVLDPDGPAHWLAELGVVFLLFSIGLEVSTERLWALRKMVLGLGLSQVVITACVVLGIALAFANPFPVAIVIGLAFALSSTAVVLQLLAERRQLSGTVGRAAFSILLLQDLAVIPILLVTAPSEPARLLGTVGGGVLGAIGLALCGDRRHPDLRQVSCATLIPLGLVGGPPRSLRGRCPVCRSGRRDGG